MATGSLQRLSAADYAVFGVTLGISAAIGIFYAIKDRRSDEGTEGYLLGGRSMGMVPVSLSLTVSYMSAISVLGAPAEIYLYGTMMWWMLLALLIVTIITAEVFIPVFFRLKLTSVYEYIERRFNRAVRLLAIILFMVSYFLYIGIVIYAPSMALSAVTGFNLWASILSTGLVCIFYTTLGGFKAVIWTDVFQAFVMFLGFIAVIIQGSIKQGGYGRVWKICNEGGRIDFARFDFDPRYRYTFWSVVVGGAIPWLFLYGVGQSQVQRYLSCKSLRHAKGAIYLNWIGVASIISLGGIIGTLLYAFYHNCDPVKTGEISAYDQLVPYMSLSIFQNHPGLTGILISSVFSGSLSTISTGINAMACVTVEDLVKPWTNWSETKYTWFTKGIVVMFGLLSIGMAYLASQLGGILQAAISIFGLIGGPAVGLFTLGFMVPFANSLGAIVATVSGIAVPTWLFLGSKSYPPSVQFTRKLPVSVAGCPIEFFQMYNGTQVYSTPITPLETTTEITSSSPSNGTSLEYLYSISYMYYALIGFLTSIIIGVLVSLGSGGWRDRKTVDASLLYFFFDHRVLSWLPNRFLKLMRCGVDVAQETDDYKLKKNNNVMRQPRGCSNNAYVDYNEERMDSNI